MQVNMLGVQHVFEKEVLYRVPLYQRPYVWTEDDQWQPLWEDIVGVAEQIMAGKPGRAHFIGATVQDHEKVLPGTIETRLLIDGQQRLTTLQLMLKAFHDLALARGNQPYASALGKLVRNHHPLNTAPHQDHKVWPTNADRADYDRVMRSGDRATVVRACGGRADTRRIGRSIVDAYLFFLDTIGEWLDGAGATPDARIAALYAAIRENVRLVVIDLDDKDDAQLIFETLNARGTPLLAADLVKNALLSAVERDTPGKSEAVYLAHWQMFDADAAFWREKIGRGHAQRARIEIFVQHALTVMTGAEVSAGQLYAAYRDYAASGKAPPALAQMATLSRYGAIYRRLVEHKVPPRVALFMERLGVMGFETIYPVLIKLFDRFDGDDAGPIPVLLDLESFLIRRLVARLSTRSYGTLFVGLLAALDAPLETLPTAFRHALAQGTAEVDRWPDDEEFGKAWRTNRLYENLTRPRLRMLLEGMEAAARDHFAETTSVPRNLQVEHVLPQSWREHWPLPDGVDAAAGAARRDELVHCIGNLTLLNGKLNASQSNRAWLDLDEGQPGKRSGLNDHGTLYLNKALTRYDAWDEAAIEERAGLLLAHAQDCWPRP